jgi:hypothetical protein
MRARTFQVRVGGRGRMKRRIVPGGILALSLAVVLLVATASTAGAERYLSPWYCPPLPTQTTTLTRSPRAALISRRRAELRLRRPAGRNDEPCAGLCAGGLLLPG